MSKEINDFISFCVTQSDKLFHDKEYSPTENIVFTIKLPRQSGHTTSFKDMTLQLSRAEIKVQPFAINNTKSTLHRIKHNLITATISSDSFQKHIDLVKQGKLECFDFALIDEFSYLGPIRTKNFLDQLKDLSPKIVVIGIG